MEEEDRDSLEEEHEFVPFRERSGWEDVVPVPQDDGPTPVVPIAYPPHFVEVMDYFRALLSKDERSERGLALSEEVIGLNAANYTAWQFRRACLYALNKDLHEELKWASQIGKENPKNYQIWHHRRALVEKTRDPAQELSFCAEMVEEDSKNYHAWSHRQWIVKEFDLWSGEVDYTETLLEKDLRNNSAWNHRFYVLTHQYPPDEAVRKAEIAFASRYIQRAPNNESAWNYLKGWVRMAESPRSYDTIQELCNGVLQEYPDCRFALSVLVDSFEGEHTKLSLEKAVEICTHMVERADVMRAKYWNHRRQNLEEKARVAP